MPWPQALDYNEAVQCPSACFRDPELRQTQVRTNAIGIPSPHSGNFADVYQMTGPGGASWAVKCFTRSVKGLQDRYQAVSDHLRESPRPFMVDFQYLEGGIRVGQAWYPAVKMRWVEGLSLSRFVADHLEDRAVLEKLAELWVRLSVQLRDAGMAHGDLQHGNIMLVPGSKANSLALKLVDYDGMCVPLLTSKPSGEFGHPNYQHPHRSPSNRGPSKAVDPSAHGYGPEMDRFSLLVIYTALRALALDGKSLWRAFDCGENLLFRDVDFQEPAESVLFKRLWTDFGGDVRALAARLLFGAKGTFADLPTLTELLDGNKVKPLTRAEEERVAYLLRIPDEKPRARANPAAETKTHAAVVDPRPTPAPATRSRSSHKHTPIAVPENRSMNPTPSPDVPVPTAEQRRSAAGQFDRANQVIATGNYDYGLNLLVNCCKLDRANLIYRQALRRTEKAKYKNNLRGHWLAWLTTWPAKARIKAALRSGDHVKVLDLGEQVLMRNPWDIGAQMDLAVAADELGLVDLAVWSLEQARQKDPNNPAVNRALALVYEKRGNFTQAMALWNMVRKARPQDVEADRKVKDLAASDTIQRGNYKGLNEDGKYEVDADVELPQTTPGRQSRKSPVIVPPRAPEGNSSSGDPQRRRIEANPTDARGYLHLAHHYRKTDDFEKARAILQEGLGPTGNAFELVAEMADLEIEPFRRDLAITEEKATAEPSNPELRQHRARLKKEIGTRELGLFRLKADRFPTEGAYRLEVGVRLLNIGQIDEAIRELQNVRSDPRHAGKAAHYLGHCFKARNNWRLAQRNFEEALQHIPAADVELRKETLYDLALICAETGDLGRAVDLGSDLAHEDYTFRDIGRLLEEWQAKLQLKE
jgi:tetratricopeptide (TPR) repeat protein